MGTGHAVGDVGPEGDPKFAAGFLQTGKGIPTAPTRVAARADADGPLLDGVAEIIFRIIGVQRHIGAFQDPQPFALVAVKPFEPLVQCLVSSAASE
jgi:hypothetical protein